MLRAWSTSPRRQSPRSSRSPPVQCGLELPDSCDFVVMLVGIADPGNAGTMLRSAEAAGADAVVLTAGSVDVFGPKCVRASAGAIFRLPVVTAASAGEALERLGGRGFSRIAATVNGGSAYDDLDLCESVVLVFGNEAAGLDTSPDGGLSGVVRATTVATIPMAQARRVAERRHGGSGVSLRGATPTTARCNGPNRFAVVRHGRHCSQTMIDEIRRINDEGAAEIAAAPSLDALASLEARLTGRKGLLSDVKRRLGGLDADDRRLVGQSLQQAQADLAARLDARRAELAGADRAERLAAERLDLTEVRAGRDAGHLHLITQVIEELEDVFVGLGFHVAEGPEVEDDWHNFTALNFGEHHPARDMQDTFFVDLGRPRDVVMRTHTSPVQIRVMEQQAPPIYSIMPGRVYRNEATDATHLAVFHQLECLVVDRGITFGHLAGTIDMFTKAFFGDGFSSRLRPSYFPFTEPSAEFDIRLPDGSWLELGGSGMVHPNVLANCGIDPEEFSGFAFGFGLDRLAATRYGVTDLREVMSTDIRFLEQF